MQRRRLMVGWPPVLLLLGVALMLAVQPAEHLEDGLRRPE